MSVLPETSREQSAIATALAAGCRAIDAASHEPNYMAVVAAEVAEQLDRDYLAIEHAITVLQRARVFAVIKAR